MGVHDIIVACIFASLHRVFQNLVFKAVSIIADHKDLIHDVSYDFHGRRIATCSSDQTVKIWDQDSGQWTCTASWRLHNGSVWRVSWADPEFGQIIATCSFDRTAVVWEEIVSDASTDKSQTVWVKRCSLVDSRTNVTDAKFAPKYWGLLLATASQDGMVRIYEAPDIMNLSQFNLQHEIAVSKQRCSCLSWNSSRYHSPLLAVGSDDTSAAQAKIHVFEYIDALRKWVKVDSIATFTDPVYDLSFAPNLGRSFHLLAVASKNVHILTMKPLNTTSESEAGTAATKFDVHQVVTLDEHGSQVWRVRWNVTGTILASSGADGAVRLWKANYMNTWKCVSTIRPNETGGFSQQT